MREHDYDKSRWLRGPWDDEPDRMQFKTKNGFPALIVRNRLGALCGYAGVAEGHRFYGKRYPDVDVDVHGGLTYSDACWEDGPICHTPEPGEPDDVWWFGFDCAHYSDLTPGMPHLDVFDGFELTYRDISYVRNEIEQLAEQLR